MQFVSAVHDMKIPAGRLTDLRMLIRAACGRALRWQDRQYQPLPRELTYQNAKTEHRTKNTWPVK